MDGTSMRGGGLFGVAAREGDLADSDIGGAGGEECEVVTIAGAANVGAAGAGGGGGGGGVRTGLESMYE